MPASEPSWRGRFGGLGRQDADRMQRKPDIEDGARVSKHPSKQEQDDDRSAERDLVGRARAGQSEALQELWRANRRWVAAIVLAHRPRTIEVEDLMQDVAVKFVSRLETLRDVDSFRPWLRRIVINVCRGAARSRKHTLHLATGPVDDVDGQRSGEQDVELSDAADRVMKQAMSLPPEYREPLLLRCVQEMTYQQIGAVLELPVTTIETRLARARRMLREEIGDEVLSEGRQ